MNLAMAGLGALLMLVGAWLLVRRRWWPAVALVLLSFAPFVVGESFARAFFTWLALLSLVVMLAVLGKGLAQRPNDR